MELRALIADDEYPAREEIRYHLKKYENINVVGEAASVTEALALINALEYDLVFLDINFPVKNGIELGIEMQNMDNSPIIIYITAYEEYALRAFDVNAIDYILKPIDEEKFDRAIKRVFKVYNNRINGNNNFDDKELNKELGEEQSKKQLLDSNLIKKVSAELNGKIYLVDLEDVYYAYVDNNYVFIKRYDDKLITKYTLASLEDKLQNMNFFRTNRSCLVNLNKIKEISTFFKGKCNLVMCDKENSNISVSRRQAKELRRIFDL